MSKVNKVKLLSERTSGVPPVIFNAETPGLGHHGQVILNIVWQKMKLEVDLSIWTIHCMKHWFFLKLGFFLANLDIFSSNLRTFLSNFVAKDVYALLLNLARSFFSPCRQAFFLSLSKPKSEFHPCFITASSWIPIQESSHTYQELLEVQNSVYWINFLK